MFLYPKQCLKILSFRYNFRVFSSKPIIEDPNEREIRLRLEKEKREKVNDDGMNAKERRKAKRMTKKTEGENPAVFEVDEAQPNSEIESTKDKINDMKAPK